MRVHFRAECNARVTEYWSIDPPGNWHRMSKGERLAWLADNIDLAEHRSDEIHGEEDRAVLDYHEL